MVPDERNSVMRDGYTFVEAYSHGNPGRNGIFDTLYIPHWLDAAATEDIVRYINAKSISKVYADSLRDFAFLRSCPCLTCLTLKIGTPLSCDAGWADKSPRDGKVDLDFLYDLPSLSELSMTDAGSPTKSTVKEVDLQRLKSLRALTTEYAYVRKLDSLAELESLYIIGLREDDLSCLSGMGRLKHLSVLQGRIKTLNGIEQMQVQTLEVAYCRNLCDLTAIKGLSQTLAKLSIDYCPKVQSIEACSALTMLESLEMDGNQSIKSLHPLDSLKRLKILLAYVNVEDGNMTICKRMKLAGFHNKKHYNLKIENLPKEIT